jgi:hypothetical protein
MLNQLGVNTLSNYRKIWEETNGKIPKGYEIHHIIPKHDGGTDDVYNLMCVTKKHHKQLHLNRYKKYGDFRDLCAYYMIGYNFTEAHRISSSNGGKIGGTKAYNENIGIFRNDEDRKKWAAMGGKVGSRVQMQKRIGIHGQSGEERLKFASMGGIASGQFQNKEFQSEMGKRGGVKNKGFIWINDGKKLFKYTAKMQQAMSLSDYINQNPHIRKGRKINED